MSGYTERIERSRAARVSTRVAEILVTGLPGVAVDRLWSTPRTSVTGVIDALRRQRCVSATGPSGSLLVYRDDNGCFRCLYHKAGNCLPVSSEIFASKEPQVRAWLRRWFPALHTAPKRRAA